MESERLRSRVHGFLRQVAAAALVAGAISCGPAGPGVGDEPIRIGVIVSLTGGLGSVGEHLAQAAQLVEREVASAGGLLGGRPVELIIVDDRTEPTQAGVLARQLIEEQGVVAIIGSLASSATLAVQAVSAEYGVPTVSCCSTSQALTGVQPEDDRYLFRTVPSDLLQSVVTARYAADNCQRLAVLHLNDEYGNPFGEAIETRFLALKSAEQEFVMRLPYPGMRPSYSSQVAMIAAANPDCIALVAFPAEGGAILRDWEALSMKPDVTWIGSDGIKDPGFPTAAGSPSIVDGVIGTAPITEPGTSAYNAFARNFVATFGDEDMDGAGIFGGNQYDAAMLLVLAIEAAGSTDGVAIRDALFEVSRGEADPFFEPGEVADALQSIRDGRGINYEGASGPVDFDSFGNVVADYEIWRYDATARSFVRSSVVRASELQ